MDGELSGDELRALLDSGEDVRVVDIRSPGAFRRGHIPGSVNVPFGDLPDRVEELDDADRVVTVCPHGEASVQAARLVASYEGVDGPVESLAPGVEGWDGDLASDGAGESAEAEAEVETEADAEEAPF